jgi:hypothetical protein
VFIIGSILQVAAQNLATMMAGRFFGGSKVYKRIQNGCFLIFLK